MARKPLSIAFEEIAAGKIIPVDPPEPTRTASAEARPSAAEVAAAADRGPHR